MYDSRWMNLGVLAFWLASMSWLVATKVSPLMQRGEVPGQGLTLSAGEAGGERAVLWDIRWNDRLIGTAENRARRNDDGTVAVASTVALQELPVDQMARELVGPLAGLLTAGDAGKAPLLVDMSVHTTMYFDAFGHLESLRSRVDVMDVKDLLELRGQVEEPGLLLVATVAPLDDFHTTADDGSRDGTRREVFRKYLDIPPDALVADALAPSPELRNLHVGQEWTYRAVRPFPPGNPWQLVRAKVLRQEVFPGGSSPVWGDAPPTDTAATEVFVVALSDSRANTLTAAAEPFSTLWVRDDGTVLRQQLAWGNLTLRFDRRAEGAATIGPPAMPIQPSLPNEAQFLNEAELPNEAQLPNEANLWQGTRQPIESLRPRKAWLSFAAVVWGKQSP